MSKHHRTAGKDFETIKIGEKKYKLRPLRVGTYAEMEAYVVEQRVDPLAIAAQAVATIPASHHDAIWNAAFRNAMSRRTVIATDMRDFEQSARGTAWKFWRSVEQDHPEVNSVDEALKLMEQMGVARMKELILKMQVSSGEADIKNSDGQEGAQTAEIPPAGQ